jgi:glyoxylase-like metal-dependent hydrolase (beta-lactamase superfamily II)
MTRAESTREVAPLARSATERLRKRPWARNPFATARVPTEILPGITLLGSRRVNFYALTEGRGVTLVDCGFYGHLRYLEGWLEQTGRKLTDIEAVVITHGHADHLGFASIFEALGVPVFVPEPDLAFARSTQARLPPVRLRRSLWRPSCLRLVLEATLDGVFTQPPVRAALGYSPSATLDVPGRLQAIHVPGHSAGNCSLYFPAAGAVFSGDSLMTRDPMLGSEGPLVFAEHPAKNQAAFASLSRLRPFADAALLPAHGEPWPERGALGRALGNARIV